ncbi:MAG: glycosyltransferase family 39 protein [Chitinophagales bacterium]|nr:glycosyltransferase family 39 protein [Chitinophagales bacterium]
MKIHQLSSERFLGIISILFLISLYINLGVQPVFLEEPRRAMIAMEMVENDNYIVPTQMGEYYYKKPPVFNWLLILSSKIFGGFSPWALRLPTVLSVLFAGLLLFGIGRRYVDKIFGWQLALLFSTGGAVYYYFSLIGEIDLFYTLVTIASFFTIFHFQQQRKWWQLFTLAYGLAAIGTLTKGLPSIPFLGLTLVAWLWYTGDWKKLFSFPHIGGIVVYGILIGGYALAYHQFNPIQDYIAQLFSESVNRTAVENSSWKIISHILNFPLDTIKDSLPGSLLLIFLIRKDWKKLLFSHPLLAFSVIAFLINYALYWLSPGTRQRYIYMLYPFLLIIGLYVYRYRDTGPLWSQRVFSVLVGVVLVVACLGSIALNFIPSFDFLHNRWLISLLFTIVFGGLFLLYRQDKQRPLLWLLLAGVVFRLFFDFTIPHQRAHDSTGQINRDKAVEIHELVHEDALYIYKGARFSFTTVYYLNRLRGKALHRKYDLIPDSYFIAPEAALPEYPALIKLQFHDSYFKLIKVE